MSKSIPFLILVFIFALSVIFPQESRIFDEDALFIITDFEFDINGRSREHALFDAGEFQEGLEVRGKANLEQYISEKRQLLINQRVLQTNVEITHTIGERQSGGAYPVKLLIKVADSLNFFVFPVPRYNTNTGLDVLLRIRDYNFMGSLSPLRIDFIYRYDQDRRNSFGLWAELTIPFRAFGYNWNLNFDSLFNYQRGSEDPFRFQSATGISMQLPARSTTFTFGFEESFNLNMENQSRHWETFGEIQRGFFMSSVMFAAWEIPTILTLPGFGQLIYTPFISATFNHRFPAWPLESIHQGPFLDFGHSLGFTRINWHGNFREGISVLLENSNRYDFYNLQNNGNPFSSSITASGIRHLIISNFFGISAKLMYRHWFYHDPAYYDMAADAIRGITNRSLSASYMLSLNLDFPLRLPKFAPSRWSGNDRLGIFDIEFHLAPILDMALYNDPGTEVTFHPRNMVVGGGFELMIFPAFIRTLDMRAKIAWNLREVTVSPFSLPRGNNREIVFTMRHFF